MGIRPITYVLPMSDVMIDMYQKAGKIVKDVRELAVSEVHEGMKVLDLTNLIESEIMKRGGFPAFPCNISINEITAHYTSPTGDETILKDGDLVKIDLGAHVNGYIADSATTVMIGSGEGPYTSGDKKYTPEKQWEMIEIVNQALEVAISNIRAGVELGKIGGAVEEYVKSQGYLPVANLAGHSMDRWILHSRLSIPNVKENNPHKIEEGDVLAIEPFVTDGIGVVGDTKDTFIFRFLRDRPLRLAPARKLLEVIKTKYGTFSFAKRWLNGEPGIRQLNPAMRQLISSRAIYPYHVLREKSGAKVAQAEHTVIVESDGCELITH